MSALSTDKRADPSTDVGGSGGYRKEGVLLSSAAPAAPKSPTALAYGVRAVVSVPRCGPYVTVVSF